jgi:predicted RNA-binding protein YlxR (DUF448 family)
MPAPTPRQRPRTCAACREEAPKRALIRVVRSPEGEVFLDERGKLPGRGAYLCARLECVGRARKTGALSRALKAEIPDRLYDAIKEYIEACSERARKDTEAAKRELRSLLSLSRLAGLVHIGMDSVQSQCAKNAKTPLLILTASDCSESVKSSVRETAERIHLETPLSVKDISAALGANNVQVIALPGRNGLADRIKTLLGGNCGQPAETRRKTRADFSPARGEGFHAEGKGGNCP